MSPNKQNSNKSINLTINGISATVPEGSTILQAAQKVNVKIPTLCDHPDLNSRAVCRICVVECDKQRKLVPACTNHVSEGMSIVTNNERIRNIRRTIIELILANHPPECLNCIRSKNCELQSLAELHGIRKTPFRRYAAYRNSLEITGDTLVRNMEKCTKCGRCVEACQVVQTVHAINTSHRSANYEISTAFNQPLSNSPCILCGTCATVCPVGAIYEHDQSAEVWEALNNSKMHVIAQIDPSAAATLERELGLPPKTISAGKIVSALKRMGFDLIFDGGYFANISISEKIVELLTRIKTSDKLPMISCCSQSINKFVENFYPDLIDRLPESKNYEQNFRTHIKKHYSHPDYSGTTFVSIVPCISKKYITKGEKTNDKSDYADKEIALTSKEFARMIRLAGIDLCAIEESSFSSLDENMAANSYTNKIDENNIEAVFCKVYEAEEAGVLPGEQSEVHGEYILQGTKVKTIIVNGLANARKVLDSIREGKCDAALVGIMNCNINEVLKR